VSDDQRTGTPTDSSKTGNATGARGGGAETGGSSGGEDATRVGSDKVDQAENLGGGTSDGDKASNATAS